MRTTTCILALTFSFGVFAQQLPDTVAYPNPANTELNVPVSDEVADVILYDLLGNQLAFEKRQAPSDKRKEFQLALPAERFPSGMYLVARRDTNQVFIDCNRFRVVK